MFTTPWISRLAALLLLVAALGTIYVFVLDPIIAGYSDTDRQIAEVREQLSRYQRLAAQRPALEKLLRQSEAEAATDGYYLNGGTDALAAAGLQDQVNALVQGKGGTLRSIQPMPGTDEQGFRRITLRVQMTATNESLFEVLYSLESGTPILFVENLDIQSRYVRQRNSAAGQQAELDEPLLSVGFDLSGYMPTEVSDAASPN
jgi:general secretion pathway protein M